MFTRHLDRESKGQRRVGMADLAELSCVQGLQLSVEEQQAVGSTAAGLTCTPCAAAADAGGT